MQRTVSTALSLALLLIFLSLPGIARGAGPKLTIDRHDFDFGQVYQGEKVSHTFRFSNLGDEPLHIEKVRTSCGCTAALLSEMEIPPGEGGEIETTFDSGRFRGPVTKTVYLYSSDPVQPVAQFHLRGTVQPEIEQSPERIDLGVMTPEVEKVARVELINRGHEEITLSSLEVTAEELRAELAETVLAPGQKGQIVVRVQPRAGTSRLNGYVIVQTSSTVTPQLRIPVHGTVAPPQ